MLCEAPRIIQIARLKEKHSSTRKNRGKEEQKKTVENKEDKKDNEGFIEQQ